MIALEWDSDLVEVISSKCQGVPRLLRNRLMHKHFLARKEK